MFDGKKRKSLRTQRLSGEIGLPQRRRGRGGVFEIRKAEGEKRKNLCDFSRKKVFSLLGVSDEGKLVAGVVSRVTRNEPLATRNGFGLPQRRRGRGGGF